MIMYIQRPVLLILSLLLLLGTACRHEAIPKPRGYFRIDLPEKAYKTYSADCPFSFEFPDYSEVRIHKGFNSQPCWIDVCFDEFNAQINISYFDLNDTNLTRFLDDSRGFAYKHTIKADAINEQLYLSDEKKVFGSLFEIKGNAASSLQFHLTDSTDHFFRGALYFNCPPNKDSLAPVVDFLKPDIIHMIETFHWK